MMPKNKKTRKPAAGMQLTRVLTQQSREIKASHPPTMSAQSIRHTKVRYISTAAGTSRLLDADLAVMVGVIALTTTTTAFLSSDFRLRRVSVWGPVATAGTPVTAAIDFNSPTTTASFSNPGSARADTSVSFDHPAYISQVPPRMALGSMWHRSNSGLANELVAITYPSGATIDFEFDFVINDQGPPDLGPAIVAGVAGSIYHLIVGNLSAVFVNTI